MIRRTVFVILLLTMHTTRMQNEFPPPLAFSGLGNDVYSLYDLETMTVSTVTRNGTLGLNETSGFPMPPREVRLRAPAQYEGQFILIDESNPETDGVVEGGYTLFRVIDDGNRIRILSGLDVFFSAVNWSPNERYVYLHTIRDVPNIDLLYPDVSNPNLLYQYDVVEDRLELLLEGVTVFEGGCQRYTPHCLIIQTNVQDWGFGTLYYLDRDVGEITIVVDSGHIPTTPRINWQGQAHVATYFVDTPDATIVYSFDVQTGIHTELLRLPAELVSDFRIDSAFLAPEGDFLMVEDWNPNTQHREAVVYDLRMSEAEEININAMFESIRSATWLTSNTLAIEGNLTETEGGFYVIDLPDGTPQRINTPSDRMYDEAWSPDGNWFAFITGEGDLYLYIVEIAPDAEPIFISDEASCVGWFPLEVSLTGEAYLCDRHHGIG